MKKFALFLSVLMMTVVVSCQKSGLDAAGPGYLVEIAANSHADLVATTHTVFEYDQAGNLVGSHLIRSTEDGVRKEFTAHPDAAYLTVRMDMENKPSTGVKRSFFYSYMFILDAGRANTVHLDGSSSVQSEEPRINR